MKGQHNTEITSVQLKVNKCEPKCGTEMHNGRKNTKNGELRTFGNVCIEAYVKEELQICQWGNIVFLFLEQ